VEDSLVSLLSVGWGRFSDWFVSATSISLWVLTLGVLATCLTYRLAALASHDRREVKRRRELIEQSRRFIKAAIGSNTSYLDTLERHRARAHGTHELANLSVDAFLDAPAVGPITVESLRQRGMFTLGDLADHRRIADIWGIGPVRLTAIRQHVALLTSRMELALKHWLPGEPMPFTRYREVDEAFDRYKSEVLHRLAQLESDLDEFVEFSAEVEAFERATLERDDATRWRTLLAEWRAAIARPGRLASRAVLLVAGLTLFAAVPFVAVVWNPEWNTGAATASVVFGWVGFHAALIAYYILADRPRGWRYRAPDPTVFDHQRLQFLALRMSAELGIAPPRLMIADSRSPASLNAFACGRPSGPSVVCIGKTLLDHMSESEVRAVLGHELGHLKHDDLRRDEAFRMLTEPMSTAADALCGVANALYLRARFRLFADDGDYYLIPRFGIPTLVFGALCVPVAAAGAVALAIRLGFETVKGVSSRLDEYEADRVGATAAGGPEHMASALTRLDEMLTIPSLAAASFQEMRGAMPGAPSVRSFIPARTRAELWLRGLLHNFGASHPPHLARLDALDNDVPVVRDLVGSISRLALALAAAATLLWGSVAGARTGFDWGAAQTDRVMHWWAEREVAAAQDSASEDGVETAKAGDQELGAIVISSDRGCNLRQEPTRRSKSLRLMRRGTECEATGAPQRGWVPATCGGAQGYVHRVCLR
jgi:Zn-dependent protease with chaperone function